MASLASPSLRGMGVEDQISINWRTRAHPHYVLRRVEPNRQARGNQEKYSVFYPYSARRQILPTVSRSIPVEHGAGWRACSCDVANLVLSGGHLTSAPLFLFVWRMPPSMMVWPFGGSQQIKAGILVMPGIRRIEAFLLTPPVSKWVLLFMNLIRATGLSIRY